MPKAATDKGGSSNKRGPKLSTEQKRNLRHFLNDLEDSPQWKERHLNGNTATRQAQNAYNKPRRPSQSTKTAKTGKNLGGNTKNKKLCLGPPPPQKTTSSAAKVMFVEKNQCVIRTFPDEVEEAGEIRSPTISSPPTNTLSKGPERKLSVTFDMTTATNETRSTSPKENPRNQPKKAPDLIQICPRPDFGVCVCPGPPINNNNFGAEPTNNNHSPGWNNNNCRDVPSPNIRQEKASILELFSSDMPITDNSKYVLKGGEFNSTTGGCAVVSAKSVGDALTATSNASSNAMAYAGPSMAQHGPTGQQRQVLNDCFPTNYPMPPPAPAQKQSPQEFIAQSYLQELQYKKRPPEFQQKVCPPEFTQQPYAQDFIQKIGPAEFSQKTEPQEFSQKTGSQELCQKTCSLDAQQKIGPQEFSQQAGPQEMPHKMCSQELPQKTCNQEFPQNMYSQELPQKMCSQELSQKICPPEFPQKTCNQEFPQNKCPQEFPQKAFPQEIPQKSCFQQFKQNANVGAVFVTFDEQVSHVSVPAMTSIPQIAMGTSAPRMMDFSTGNSMPGMVPSVCTANPSGVSMMVNAPMSIATITDPMDTWHCSACNTCANTESMMIPQNQFYSGGGPNTGYDCGYDDPPEPAQNSWRNPRGNFQVESMCNGFDDSNCPKRCPSRLPFDCNGCASCGQNQPTCGSQPCFGPKQPCCSREVISNSMFDDNDNPYPCDCDPEPLPPPRLTRQRSCRGRNYGPSYSRRTRSPVQRYSPARFGGRCSSTDTNQEDTCSSRQMTSSCGGRPRWKYAYKTCSSRCTSPTPEPSRKWNSSCSCTRRPASQSPSSCACIGTQYEIPKMNQSCSFCDKLLIDSCNQTVPDEVYIPMMSPYSNPACDLAQAMSTQTFDPYATCGMTSSYCPMAAAQAQYMPAAQASYASPAQNPYLLGQSGAAPCPYGLGVPPGYPPTGYPGIPQQATSYNPGVDPMYGVNPYACAPPAPPPPPPMMTSTACQPPPQPDCNDRSSAAAIRDTARRLMEAIRMHMRSKTQHCYPITCSWSPANLPYQESFPIIDLLEENGSDFSSANETKEGSPGANEGLGSGELGVQTPNYCPGHAFDLLGKSRSRSDLCSEEFPKTGASLRQSAMKLESLLAKQVQRGFLYPEGDTLNKMGKKDSRQGILDEDFLASIYKEKIRTSPPLRSAGNIRDFDLRTSSSEDFIHPQEMFVLPSKTKYGDLSKFNSFTNKSFFEFPPKENLTGESVACNADIQYITADDAIFPSLPICCDCGAQTDCLETPCRVKKSSATSRRIPSFGPFPRTRRPSESCASCGGLGSTRKMRYTSPMSSCKSGRSKAPSCCQRNTCCEVERADEHGLLVDILETFRRVRNKRMRSDTTMRRYGHCFGLLNGCCHSRANRKRGCGAAAEMSMVPFSRPDPTQSCFPDFNSCMGSEIPCGTQSCFDPMQPMGCGGNVGASADMSLLSTMLSAAPSLGFGCNNCNNCATECPCMQQACPQEPCGGCPGTSCASTACQCSSYVPYNVTPDFPVRPIQFPGWPDSSSKNVSRSKVCGGARNYSSFQPFPSMMQRCCWVQPPLLVPMAPRPLPLPRPPPKKEVKAPPLPPELPPPPPPGPFCWEETSWVQESPSQCPTSMLCNNPRYEIPQIPLSQFPNLPSILRSCEPSQRKSSGDNGGRKSVSFQERKAGCDEPLLPCFNLMPPMMRPITYTRCAPAQGMMFPPSEEVQTNMSIPAGAPAPGVPADANTSYHAVHDRRDGIPAVPSASGQVQGSNHNVTPAYSQPVQTQPTGGPAFLHYKHQKPDTSAVKQTRSQDKSNPGISSNNNLSSQQVQEQRHHQQPHQQQGHHQQPQEQHRHHQQPLQQQGHHHHEQQGHHRQSSHQQLQPHHQPHQQPGQHISQHPQPSQTQQTYKNPNFAGQNQMAPAQSRPPG